MSGAEGVEMPEVLRRLSEVIPARIRLGQRFRDGAQDVSVFDDSWKDNGGWLLVYAFDPNLEKESIQFDRTWRDTREALEQEILSRGWTIGMDIRPGTQPKRHCAVLYTPQFCSAHADTPAHALALALLSALEGKDETGS